MRVVVSAITDAILAGNSSVIFQMEGEGSDQPAHSAGWSGFSLFAYRTTEGEIFTMFCQFAFVRLRRDIF